MKRHYLVIFVFLLVGFGVLASISYLNASSKEDIVFPVAELGNCGSENECKTYCDGPENFEACIAFAEKYNLMSQEEINMAKKVGGKDGPGGCRGDNGCKSYCDDINNIEECLAFAEENDILPPDELEEAKKVAQALKGGAKMPGGCTSKERCEDYCGDPENTEECVAFAEAAGFMSPEEVAMVRKTGGKGPGDCRGKNQCDAYCEDSAHMEECINFAIEYDLMPPEEKEETLKVLDALKKGVKMPNCRGREECDVYCSEPQNMMECVTFAEAAGFMSAEEAEEAKKMAELGITSGPGGCKGKGECEAYCDDPNHSEECISFAEKAGFMSQEEAEMARKMGGSGPGGCKGKEECESYCNAPEHNEECFNFASERGLIPPEELEEMKKGMEMMREGGPGGCRSEEECRAYCDTPDHEEECFNFAKEKGLISPEEMQRMEQGNEMMRQIEQMRREEIMEEGEADDMMRDDFFEGTEGMMPEGEFEGGYMPSPEEMEQMRNEGTQEIQEEMIRRETERTQQQIMEEETRKMEEMIQQEMGPTLEQQMPIEQIPIKEPTEQSPSSQIYQESLLGIIIGPFLRIFGF